MRKLSVAVMALALVAAVVAQGFARGGGGGGGGGRAGGGGGRSFGGYSGGRSYSAPQNFNRGVGAGDRAIGQDGINREATDRVNRGPANAADIQRQIGAENVGDRGAIQTNKFAEDGVNRSQRAFSNDPARRDAWQNSDARAQWADHNRPFTPDWYANHPNAWRYTHPNADAWAAISLASASAWLGWGAVGEPVTYDNYYTNTPVETVATDATNLADNGSQEVSADGEWLNIGTYAVTTAGQTNATLMISLAVNKDGVLRGTYYDLLSNATQTIQGSIDRQTQRAAWRIGDSPTTFQTSLADLTATSTPVSVQLENGTSQKWSMVREIPNQQQQPQQSDQQQPQLQQP